MRAIPQLLAHSSFELIVAGVFLLAMYIRWLFLHAHRSRIGFWAGLACLAAAEGIVQIAVTPPPGACNPSGVSCEWLGIGRLFLLLLGLGLAALYLILGLVMSRAYRRLVQGGESTRRLAPRVVLYLSAVLACGTLAGLALGIGVTNVAESGLSIPWQRLSNIPLAGGEKITRIAAAGPFFVILETDQSRYLKGKFNVYSPAIQSSWEILPTGSIGYGKTVADFQPCEVDFWVPPPPETPAAYASARTCDKVYASQADIAIVDSRTLYVWSRQVSLDSFPDYNLAGLAGPALGFTLAMVLALLFERKLFPPPVGGD